MGIYVIAFMAFMAFMLLAIPTEDISTYICAFIFMHSS